MELHLIDKCIIIGYVVLVIALGWLLQKRASKDLDAYFLGGRNLPWYVIGTSHGASGFDITGTMLFVVMLFTYGIKAAWIPWMWPLFDRVFRQVYLGPWIRKSNVLTGAEWMRTRFGTKTGGTLSHISVVVYALLATVGFLGYAFKGIGKFAEVFFPWELAWGPFSSPDMYAIIILMLTTAYVVVGGWYSVVLTDILQFFLLTIASVAIAVVAMNKVTPDALANVVPHGWGDLFSGWRLNLDWSDKIAGLNAKILDDGYSFFGVIVMAWLFKGLLVSMAGPTPGYGIQHVLSTRSPREAALENWWMSIVQLVPRFLMITGVAVLGLVYFSPEVNAMLERGDSVDFEQILPYVIRDFIPPVLVGILLAGLLAAFMSTFDSTLNAGAAYIVNDIYKRYICPAKDSRTYIRMSYIASIALVCVAIVVGMKIQTILNATKWITAALYGGYLAPNVLKWHWWRFNGYGYFGGMIAGVLAAVVIPMVLPGMHALAAFPIIFGISTVTSVAMCLLTPPEDDEVLVKFYKDVRPWGFWGPVLAKLQAVDPDALRNRHFSRDAFNVAIGIVWQLTLMVIPICIVIRKTSTLWISVAVLVVTSVIMKFTWYDKLGEWDE